MNVPVVRVVTMSLMCKTLLNTIGGMHMRRIKKVALTQAAFGNLELVEPDLRASALPIHFCGKSLAQHFDHDRSHHGSQITSTALAQIINLNTAIHHKSAACITHVNR